MIRINVGRHESFTQLKQENSYLAYRIEELQIELKHTRRVRDYYHEELVKVIAKDLPARKKVKIETNKECIKNYMVPIDVDKEIESTKRIL